MKKILALLLAVVMVMGLFAACGGNGDTEDTTTEATTEGTTEGTTEATTEATTGDETTEGGVMAWTSEFAFNSDAINQWKTIYLLDEDNYIITVYAVDSQDATKTTADFYMGGKYTLDGNQLTVEPGYGYTWALNGDTPIEMPVMPDNGSHSAMYMAMMGMYETYTLNADGTFTGNETAVESGEFVACYSDSAKAYTVEAMFNSDTVNQWKTIYLLDEDNYIVTVDALDSQDATKVTADFYCGGKYTQDGTSVVLNPGYGYTWALNGDTPIEMPVAPDNGAHGGMYMAMIGMYSSYTLNEDGTWTGVE